MFRKIKIKLILEGQCLFGKTHPKGINVHREPMLFFCQWIFLSNLHPFRKAYSIIHPSLCNVLLINYLQRSVMAIPQF